jgi:integrase
MLTEISCRTAKPGPKPRKMFDERGLYLLVTTAGGRLWRFKYRIEGREKLLGLGAYPDVPLKRAREKRDAARQLLADGIDPSIKRRAEKLAQADTLEAIAREWFEKKASSLSAGTLKRDLDRLEKYVLPSLGRRPIRSITPADLVVALQRIEARGTMETAHRTRSLLGRIWRYAVGTSRAERDITADLRDALLPVVVRNHPSIKDPKAIGQLLQAIEGYSGQPTTHAALRLAPLLFVRPGELRGAKWDEFDLDAAMWRIPGERMKMAVQHLVPLSSKAVAILRELHALTGDGPYLFPSLRSAHRPMSENTINAALRRLGYSKDEMTGHGFRSIASTLLNEQGFNRDVIERQLAHAERDGVRAAYNYAEYLSERTRMMQSWADYLDLLKSA